MPDHGLVRLHADDVRGAALDDDTPPPDEGEALVDHDRLTIISGRDIDLHARARGADRLGDRGEVTALLRDRERRPVDPVRARPRRSRRRSKGRGGLEEAPLRARAAAPALLPARAMVPGEALG